MNDDNLIDLEGKTIEVSTGIIKEDTTEEFIPLGTFIIDTSDDENVKDKTTFTGYDRMIKFNTEYVDRVSYPITLYNYLLDLCDRMEIELGTQSIINGSYEILGNPFTNNETNMTVLSNIAQLAGGFAKIGKDNKLYIVALNKEQIDANVAETIDGNNYNDSFTKNDMWGEVNSLIVRLSDIEGENVTREDAESIEQYGLTELTIADNYFLIDSTERETIIDELWDNLKGLKYLPFSTDYYGYPYLDTGDMIKIADNDDTYYFTYVFNHTIKYGGVYSGNLTTPAMTKTQTAYKNNAIKNAFRRTEYIINKMNGQIIQVTEQVSENGQQLVQVQQNIEGIQTEIRDTTDDIQDEIVKIKEDLAGIITEKTVVGGQNLIKNSVGYFGHEYWQIDNEHEGNVSGNTSSDVKQHGISGSALYLKNETIYQSINDIKNGQYFLSFTYRKRSTTSTAVCNLIINETVIELNNTTWTEVEQIIDVTGNSIMIQISSDINNSCFITDLMLVEGNIKKTWTQNANESYTDNVQIGKGIKIKSTGTDTEFEATADGIGIKNSSSNQNVSEFTKYGTVTEELTVNKDAKIANGILIQKIGSQTWFSSL